MFKLIQLNIKVLLASIFINFFTVALFTQLLLIEAFMLTYIIVLNIAILIKIKG